MPPPKVDNQDSVFSPWTDLVANRNFRDINHKLHHEILAFDAWALPTPKESTVLQNVLRTITSVVKSRLYDAQVIPFGSTVTGLTLPIPDLDLVIMSNRLRTPREVKNHLFVLQSAFCRAGLIDTAEVRIHAKVPIIRFTTRPQHGNIHVDISVNHTDGVDVADIIKDYKTRMPALRPLALIMKNIVGQAALNDPSHSGIGSYALVCMCINFLQVNPSKLDDTLIQEPVKHESLGTLLAELLHYYGVSFNYSDLYVSVKEQQALPKEGVSWIRESKPPKPTTFVVQCLKNEDKNIAASLGGNLSLLQECFKTAYASYLQQTSSTRDVLLHITGFSQEVLDHRRAIDALSLPDIRPTPTTSNNHGFPLQPNRNSPSNDKQSRHYNDNQPRRSNPNEQRYRGDYSRDEKSRNVPRFRPYGEPERRGNRI